MLSCTVQEGCCAGGQAGFRESRPGVDDVAGRRRARRGKWAAGEEAGSLRLFCFFFFSDDLSSRRKRERRKPQTMALAGGVVKNKSKKENNVARHKVRILGRKAASGRCVVQGHVETNSWGPRTRCGAGLGSDPQVSAGAQGILWVWWASAAHDEVPIWQRAKINGHQGLVALGSHRANSIRGCCTGRCHVSTGLVDGSRCWHSLPPVSLCRVCRFPTRRRDATPHIYLFIFLSEYEMQNNGPLPSIRSLRRTKQC